MKTKMKVARAMAIDFIGYRSRIEGRGSECRDCIKALAEAGQ